MREVCGSQGGAEPAAREGYAEERLFVQGEVVARRYRISRFIARGGIGEVYAAHDTERGMPVALKASLLPTGANDKSLRRFRRGVELARRIRHPNVCRVFDLGFHRLPEKSPLNGEKEVVFTSMELLEGETLESMLKAEGPLSTLDCLPILEQIVAGLAAAHDLGIVHRDFKPSNVLLVPAASGKEGLRVVVTDFGLARLQGNESQSAGVLTTDGQLVGTPDYMAPEQLSGGNVTPAVDIYALGVVLYEALTGARPFAGKTAFARAFQRLNAAPQPPRTYVPDLDPRWDDMVMRCLDRQPGGRFLGVRDLIHSLRESHWTP